MPKISTEETAEPNSEFNQYLNSFFCARFKVAEQDKLLVNALEKLMFGKQKNTWDQITEDVFQYFKDNAGTFAAPKNVVQQMETRWAQAVCTGQHTNQHTGIIEFIQKKLEECEGNIRQSTLQTNELEDTVQDVCENILKTPLLRKHIQKKLCTNPVYISENWFKNQVVTLVEEYITKLETELEKKPEDSALGL